MQHAVTQRKERLTGVAEGAKGLPRPVRDRTKDAGRARGLPGLVRDLPSTATLARTRRVPPLARSLLARAALDALFLGIDAFRCGISPMRTVRARKIGGEANDHAGVTICPGRTRIA